ncbi:hypothetical protein BB561_001088 [Smittium simulii]|uniref:Dol-P-Man:Man(5)GlcNAc(2)-PP-Dol alpha-1,3-mannosyltransferase n=1 Tax=Smittium simulii TaxID=133385 RepID=A0A2T9YW71_9FUNG|nr:hypothetical protein BB561_001088 [Smittium simulii]
MTSKFLKYGLPALFLAELSLNLFIVNKVSYVEIDWKAYMEQVELFVSGERNYLKIEGGTGPLVPRGGLLKVIQMGIFGESIDQPSVSGMTINKPDMISKRLKTNIDK